MVQLLLLLIAKSMNDNTAKAIVYLQTIAIDGMATMLIMVERCRQFFALCDFRCSCCRLTYGRSSLLIIRTCRKHFRGFLECTQYRADVIL